MFFIGAKQRQEFKKSKIQLLKEKGINNIEVKYYLFNSRLRKEI